MSNHQSARWDYRWAAFAALLVLKRRSDEPPVLDGDTHALSRLKAGGLDPSSGELNLRKAGRLIAHMEGQACRFLVAPGFLDGDRPFDDGRESGSAQRSLRPRKSDAGRAYR